MDIVIIPYFQLLLTNIQTDSSILSQGWLWAYACIPALGYMMVMMLKWTMLLIPIWLPLYMAFQGVAKATSGLVTFHARWKQAKR
jgi:hypothetical protein